MALNNNKNFKLINMKYNTLSNVNSYVALKHIIELSLASIDMLFMQQLYNSLVCRELSKKHTVFAYIPAPTNKEVIQRVIGKNGYYFKLTTQKCEVDFIWHDRDHDMFLVWGSSNYKVVKALNCINYRIVKANEIINNNYLQEQHEQQHEQQHAQDWKTQQTYDDDDEDYSDMPGLIPCSD